MQRKLKLSFCALMTSGFFVKIASADGVTIPKEKLLPPVSISEHLEETRKLLSEVRGLKEKRGRSKRIENKQTVEGSKPSEKERKRLENLFFEVLTNLIISDGATVYITNRDSEDSKINSFKYKDAGYSINNTFQEDGKLYIDAVSVSRDQTIESGANAEGAKIYGGDQIILGKEVLGTGLSRKEKESSAYNTEIYAEDGILGLQSVYYFYAENGEAVTEVENLILNGENAKLYSIAPENNDTFLRLISRI